MDPMTLIMFGLIAVLIIFMIRNGKKRQQAQQEMQSNLVPGAEVMLQSGIFGTVEEVDEEDNRVTVRSGTSTIVVHRNAVGQIIAPVESDASDDEVAPDDDPEFGERVGEGDSTAQGEAESAAQPESDDEGKPEKA
ncbi:preprotein translocase subunit YajC [Leucobacter weissii]|uniref:Preprotein translocase subunit YajC n=1 Tax=Leucobacter weissii TaxID=1983706 RepID=A0A939MJ86_9MICO|nr:preprotein translocase subunit YajC [Leucobacter weissii]MBO1901964.1 preprotein translocase subunit YajC [Leucobacter weissii]